MTAATPGGYKPLASGRDRKTQALRGPEPSVRRRGVRVERDEPPRERVPEFALAAGVAVALTALAAGVLLGAGLRATLVLGGLALAPFLAYAVHHSPDPTGVLPPRPVAGLAGVAGLLALGDAVLAAGPAGLPAGLALATAFALPALAYLARYDPAGPPLAPRTAALAAAPVTVAVLAVGAGLGRPLLGAATALAVGLAGARHAVAGGLVPSARTRRRVVAALVLAGIGLAGAGLAGSAGAAVVAGAALALGGGLFGVLARPPSHKS